MIISSSLKTVMTSMINWTGALQRQRRCSPNWRTLHSGRLSSVVDRLLIFARYPPQISEVVEQIIQLWTDGSVLDDRLHLADLPLLNLISFSDPPFVISTDIVHSILRSTYFLNEWSPSLVEISWREFFSRLVTVSHCRR